MTLPLEEIHHIPSGYLNPNGIVVAQKGELLDVSGPIPTIRRQGESLRDVVVRCAQANRNVMSHLSTETVYYQVATAPILELPGTEAVAIMYFKKVK